MEATLSVSSASTASAARCCAPPEVTAAACALFDRFERPVLHYCLRHLRSRDDAEDAVQNTFLRAFSSMRRGVVPDVEAAWLFKIAHNVCLSQGMAAARRARREAVRDLDGPAEPAATLVDTDDLFGLDDALAAMPAQLRTPLLLRDWQGLSYKEIAEALGTSDSAVTTLIFRARRHLAQALRGTSDKPANGLVAAA